MCPPASSLCNHWYAMFWGNILNVLVYLQPGINGEAASRGVHAGNVLNVVYFFQKQFITVIPAEHTQGEKKEKKIIIQLLCRHRNTNIGQRSHTDFSPGASS